MCLVFKFFLISSREKFIDMNRYIKIILLLLVSARLSGQITYDRIEPPFWWTGMRDTTLQLMIHGHRIAESSVIVDHKLVKAVEIRRVENPNYMFVDLLIPRGTKAGKIKLVFQYQREILFKVDYELKERAEGSERRQGFGREDVIYMLMPDRFSNGDLSNDSMEVTCMGSRKRSVT